MCTRTDSHTHTHMHIDTCARTHIHAQTDMHTVFIHIKAGFIYTQGLKYMLGSAAE